jgi:hypothetical protein
LSVSYNKFESRSCEVYSTQHYVIKFVSDLRQVGFFPPVSSTNKTDRHDITVILLKVALNSITLTPKTEQWFIIPAISCRKGHTFITMAVLYRCWAGFFCASSLKQRPRAAMSLYVEVLTGPGSTSLCSYPFRPRPWCNG